MPNRDDQVDHVMQTLFRILRACGISRQAISDAAARALESSGSTRPVKALAAPPGQHLACTDVVFGWRRNPEFLDSHGNPNALPVAGAGVTFEHLCGLVAPDYQASVLLDYLEALGAIKTSTEGFVELTADSVLACRFDERRTVAPRTVLPHLVGFLGAVEHNVAGPSAHERGRFERACYSRIPRALLPVFERFVEVRGQNFVDSVDEWLVRHRNGAGESEDSCLVGAGAYVLIHNSNIFEL